MSPFQIQNAAEAIQKLTEDAAVLAAKLRQLIAALQQSSSTNAASTSQHLTVYQEAVQTLQVVMTNFLHCSQMFLYVDLVITATIQ